MGDIPDEDIELCRNIYYNTLDYQILDEFGLFYRILWCEGERNDWMREGVHLSGKNSGFTLIEILLVILILGILTSLAVPDLLHFSDRWVLRSTACQIANDIRRVQRISVQESDSCHFELHTGECYYLIRRENLLFDPIKKVSLDPRISEISSTLYSPNYGGEWKDYRILRFSYLGSPNQAGSILLKTKHGNHIRITVEVATGRVRVYE